MRPAGTISDAKQTSEINCGSGAVVRHQPQTQISKQLATLRRSLAHCGHRDGAVAAHISALTDPQGLWVLNSCPCMQNSSCFWA